MSLTTTAKTATPVAFPAQALEASIREFLAEEGAMQGVLHGSIGPQPVIDSLVVVDLLLELETHVPFELPDSLVQAGGYDSVDEVVQNLLPKVQQRWNQHHKEKS